MFPLLSMLNIDHCPKLELPCLPSLKNLYVRGCNNELLRSISSFCGLITLTLSGGNKITSFPDVMEHLTIDDCNELESLPEQIWEGAVQGGNGGGLGQDITHSWNIFCVKEAKMY
ncbi:NBS-LRR disease resistance protein, partial [Trifolium medium]|nr:NBS-LRR disease resistance protein [Trifolium medium]